MKIWFIRHGKTKGNLRGAYIGRTDEPLCSQGEAELRENSLSGLYPPGEVLEGIAVSPMLRCRQTAQLLFGEVPMKQVPDLRETDFGIFEGKTFAQLEHNPAYRAWLDSGGQIPFPGGESREAFCKRSVDAVGQVLEQWRRAGVAQGAFIVHGGTIMAAMEAFEESRRGFYDWQVKNGLGFCVQAVQPQGAAPVFQVLRRLERKTQV